MGQSFRIAVADDEPDMRAFYQKALSRLGHQVIVVAENGRELVVACKSSPPDLVVTDIRMPELDGIEAAIELYRQHPLPVILVSAFYDAELLARAEADHVMSYLVKPIKLADLEVAISLTMRRFQEFQTLRSEAADLRQALQHRKIVEQAKKIIMRKMSVSESDAFDHLDALARTKSIPHVDLAQLVVAEDMAQR